MFRKTASLFLALTFLILSASASAAFESGLFSKMIETEYRSLKTLQYLSTSMLTLGFIELAQLFPVFRFPKAPEVFRSTVNSTSSAGAEFEIMYRSTFYDISTFPTLYLIHPYLFLHRLLFMIPRIIE